MIRMSSVLRDQRGSALLISMVLIVVITILGLALFELGQIEGQHTGVSLGDARAFEVAQAGMERAIRELSNAFLADPYGSESWVDGRPKVVSLVPDCLADVWADVARVADALGVPQRGADIVRRPCPPAIGAGIVDVHLVSYIAEAAHDP